MFVTFVGTSADSLAASFIISSQIITESSIVITKYSASSQLHVAGFQTQSCSHALCYFGFLHSDQHLLLFHF